jgi:hypothetical protein
MGLEGSKHPLNDHHKLILVFELCKCDSQEPLFMVFSFHNHRLHVVNTAKIIASDPAHLYTLIFRLSVYLYCLIAITFAYLWFRSASLKQRVVPS